MARLFKRKRAKKQAEELAKKTALIELRDRNRAKREADLKARKEVAKAKVPGMSGLASADESAKKQAEMKKFKKESEAAEVRTKRGKSNLRSRASVGFGEAYERVEADGTLRKVIKKDPSKKSQPKPAMDQSASNVKSKKEKVGEHSRVQYGKEKKTYTSKPGESLAAFRKRIKPEMEKNKNTAKHGGALAIMIAPVKTKKMKAVKKAPGGAAMKKMPSYKKGGALKSVPSDAKGLSKLPASVRNKMGYMKDGGKVKKVKKKDKKSLEAAQKNLENKKRGNYKLESFRKHGTRVGNTHTLRKKGDRTDMEQINLARAVAKKEGRAYVSKKSREDAKAAGIKLPGRHKKRNLLTDREKAEQKKKAMYGVKMKK